MQTFLPYPSFAESASVLDNKRLGKQRVEAKQIYLALTVPNYGWKNHPAVKMWAGCEESLLRYGLFICLEWTGRGFKDSLYEYFWDEIEKTFPRADEDILVPSWIGNQQFHASHRSNLLRKDTEHYGKFGWSEPNDLPYYWPTKQTQ